MPRNGRPWPAPSHAIGPVYLAGAAPSGGEHGSGLDAVQLGEALIEIGLALFLDAILDRPVAAHRGIVAVAAIQLRHDVRAFGHRAERGEPLPVQHGVVLQVDEQLRGARVGPAVANTMLPFLLLCFTGSSLMLAFCQTSATAGLAGMPNCTMKLGTTRKKLASVKKPFRDQVVEAVRSQGSPIAMHFDHEIALGGGELHPVEIRRLGDQRRRIHEPRGLAGRRPAGPRAVWVRSVLVGAGACASNAAPIRRLKISGFTGLILLNVPPAWRGAVRFNPKDALFISARFFVDTTSG